MFFVSLTFVSKTVVGQLETIQNGVRVYEIIITVWYGCYECLQGMSYVQSTVRHAHLFEHRRIVTPPKHSFGLVRFEVLDENK
jgi:hypothetical protein